MSNTPHEQPTLTQSPEVEGRTWQVRPFRESDLPGLLSLYSQVFRRERSPEEFRWKLRALRSPVDTVWVAADGERIVGQHAGIPMRLKLGESEVLAMHAVEAMTHDDYRQQGMLTLLGGGLYRYWRDSGVPLVMGLPHPGWGSRAYALGYREVFPMRWLSRPLRPIAILLSKVGLRRATAPASISEREPNSHLYDGDLQVSSLQTASSEIDALWSNLGPQHRNAVVRDADWVQWRYLDLPGNPFTLLLARRGGKPAGYVAYRVVMLEGRKIGRIGDLFAAPDDHRAVRSLARAAMRDMQAQGAESASMLVAVGSSLHGAMRKEGFLLNRGEYQASFIQLSDSLPMEAVSAPAAWLLTGGDFDVV